MKFIKDVTEHPIVQGLTVVILILSYVLDAYSKQEYFTWAAGVIALLIFLVGILVYRQRKLYDQEILPIPIVVNIDSDESARYVLKKLFDQLEKNSKLQNLQMNLKRYRNIVEDDLVFTYSGDLYDKDRIISFMQIIKYQIKKIKENTPNKVEFHLAYYKRPAFGVFLGYIFSEEDLVVYQKNPDKDHFDKVAQTENRNYKTSINRYQKFNKKFLKEDQTHEHLLVGIEASSHKLNFNADGLNHFQNIILLEAKHKGTIGIDEDWIQYVREIFTVLNEEQTKYKYITIAHCMPESIAVLLGMAVGNYWSLKITQYDQGIYKTVMNTNSLKYYF